ncbi:MAG: bifunctional tetrahydrofolate synthase/dihydrofolate synthase [Pseudohongiellaceae bacterium]
MNLASWLQTIQALHPVEIDLGLDRVRRVADSLGLSRPAPIVITVAGTNGKGSCVALLQQVLLAAGYRTGAYTSPHIHCYNERLQLDGMMVSDAQLCTSFAAVEAARQAVSLTYFEFGTLSALYLMEQAKPDVAILEVGLGGRLDAVNIIDADVCVISQIGVDHTDWLGPDRESIGREKAGIFRSAVPVVCGEPEPPVSLLEHALQLHAPIHLLGRDYGFDSGSDNHWSWWGQERDGASAALARLPATILATDHAATVIQVLKLLPLDISLAALELGISTARLAGRFELLNSDKNRQMVLLDVAHNPSAAERLALGLLRYRQEHPGTDKIAAVLAIMADKDVEGFCQALASEVNIWYIAQVDQPRAMQAQKLAELLDSMGLTRFPTVFADPADAYRTALETSHPRDLILVTGSFFTVAAVRGYLTGLGTGS